MYTYTTTSTSHPSYKERNNNFSTTSSYEYTTTSTSSTYAGSSYRYTTTSATSSSTDEKYRFSTTKDCMICVETFNMNQFQKITSSCTHPNDICKNCVSQHIETQLNTMGDVEGILCPFGSNCGFLIEYNDVRRTVNPELFER